ncbi:hypothetical protein Tco_0969259 [Tanacetum coccineum]
MLRGKAKVSCESVCLPKAEGGHGIRRLELFNVALITSHIWNIILLKESLWVKWIHTHKLRGRNFWEVPFRGSNGYTSSACSGYSFNDAWSWSAEWGSKFPNITDPALSCNKYDVLVWRDRNRDFKNFSVGNAWKDIRPSDVDVAWLGWISSNTSTTEQPWKINQKVNEKVYAAQVGCEQCKGPYYTKYCPLKEEGKALEEAYYTQFGGPFQGGGYRATAPGYYQRNNVNPPYQEQRKSMEDTLSKFMGESAKRHEEYSNLIKEIRASTDAAIRNQGASIKT